MFNFWYTENSTSFIHNFAFAVPRFVAILPRRFFHGQWYCTPTEQLQCQILQAAQKVRPARPQGVRRLRRTLGVRRKETDD